MPQVFVEDILDIVVELVGAGGGVHGHDSALRPAALCRLDVRAQEMEVGNGDGVVVFERIGVETDKVRIAGVESEVGLAV